MKEPELFSSSPNNNHYHISNIIDDVVEVSIPAMSDDIMYEDYEDYTSEIEKEENHFLEQVRVKTTKFRRKGVYGINSMWSRYSALCVLCFYSCASLMSFYSVGAILSFASLVSIASLMSLTSISSILSINSITSFLSNGSSFSILSSQSEWSILSFQSRWSVYSEYAAYSLCCKATKAEPAYLKYCGQCFK